MKDVTRMTVLFLMSTAVALASCAKVTKREMPVKPENDKAAVERLISQYIETINLCDTALVNRIWSHDTKVSFIGPSGYYSTYQEIRDSLVVGIFGTWFTKRDLRKDELKVHVNDSMAWSEFTWIFDATRIDGTAHHTKGRETQIFEKGVDGEWRLVHIHYSGIR